MMEDFIGMYIDEDRLLLDISDHNLVRVWFTMKNKNTKWKKTNPKKTIEWVGKDEKSLKKFEEAFENKWVRKLPSRNA